MFSTLAKPIMISKHVYFYVSYSAGQVRRVWRSDVTGEHRGLCPSPGTAAIGHAPASIVYVVSSHARPFFKSDRAIKACLLVPCNTSSPLFRSSRSKDQRQFIRTSCASLEPDCRRTETPCCTTMYSSL